MPKSAEIYAQSIFVDSGAHSIYNIEVLKLQDKVDRKSSDKRVLKRDGGLLGKPPVKWGGGRFDHFNLDKGTPFRKYCNSYAKYIKEIQALPGGDKVLFANVDAISNPKKTLEIQRYFENEHGVQPVPIVHYGTPMSYVDKYLKPEYDLLGVGGLGQGVSRHEYLGWGNIFFGHICPKSNRYEPMIKTHGFAMTSHELMRKWPWWSVDSATWVKLSAYGWLYLPRWSAKGQRWMFEKPPLMINFSERSPQKKKLTKHFDGRMIPNIKETAERWLARIGMTLGSVDGEGEVDEFGVSSHHRARSIANLTYLMDFGDSLPEYPWAYHPGGFKGGLGL